MDISSAHLTSLLKEAFTPETLPSATADPVKTALIKAICGAAYASSRAIPAGRGGITGPVAGGGGQGAAAIVFSRGRAGLSVIDRTGRG